MGKSEILENKEFVYYPVRKPRFEFSEPVAKHWLGDSAYRTHILNAWTLIFPDGERYFIRTVQPFLSKIKDPRVLRNAKAFIGQEAQHAGEHKKFWRNLEDQGYRIKGFIKFFNKFAFGFLEKIAPKRSNLSVTAGLEHYTSLIATVGLGLGVLKQADPQMRKLFEWHAAEEIEHKSAAYDVYLDTGGGYFRRVIGMIVASILFWSFTFLGAEMLLWQDGLTFNWKVRRDAFEFIFWKEKVFFHGIFAFLKYFHPRFHPEQEDNYHLSREIFTSPEHQYKEVA
ncbi:metal-dependent hydrolase [Leptospira perolatii]|uniref:Metal-dependent hydrolase n=1 Tax=Leptospira perolatii TaxID=2023191 RepID=A0A2M9ZST4_9LEPT|nr:metal-dependent hydrolase [Leptospira perolatii]PJZ68797.1 metal-dependent hydrolase [Leptospira perolatii]PJZ75152.1 metal-dependent hydrolase [Leptospira perolatii]